jgi:hypothetical protein
MNRTNKNTRWYDFDDNVIPARFSEEGCATLVTDESAHGVAMQRATPLIVLAALALSRCRMSGSRSTIESRLNPIARLSIASPRNICNSKIACFQDSA